MLSEELNKIKSKVDEYKETLEEALYERDCLKS